MLSTAGALLLALLQTADALGLHAVKKHGKKHGSHKMSYGRVYRNEGCAPLDNRGTHFTIDVEVGTPGQRFSVVADTGSNTLIVPSCVCQERGQCPADGSEHCFTGTNRSSSFQVERDANGPTSLVLTFGSGQIKGIVAKERVKVGQVEAFLDDGLLLMTDRALNIQGAFEGILGLGVPQLPEDQPAQQPAEPTGYADKMAAEAAAKAGGEQPAGDYQQMPANMQEIMQKILGQMQRGELPAAPQPGQTARGDQQVTAGPVSEGGEDAGRSPEDYMRQVVGAMNISGGGMMSASIGHALVASAGSLVSAAAQGTFEGQNPLEDMLRKIMSGQAAAAPMADAPPQRAYPKGFLEQAKVDRFSVCFNDGSSGVLSLGGEMPKASHGGIGKQHWGVDFRGISVGNETLPSQALFCTPETTNMTEEQKTPCGAIPDSGTTTIMGPADQVLKLMEGICDGWDRCRQNFTKLEEAEKIASEAMQKHYGTNVFHMQGTISKSDVLQLLLMDCDSWGQGGMDELPDLHFHIRGSDGKAQALKIPGHMYVMEMSGDQAESALKLLEGVGSIPANTSLAKSMKKVCTPMFGEMDYKTSGNGPVWILGTPIFYEYAVGYDMKASPPAMSFTSQSEQPCGSCKATVNLAMSKATTKMRNEQTAKATSRGPRRGIGPPRVPRIDTTRPL